MLTECLFVDSQACNAVCVKGVGILMSHVSDLMEIDVMCIIDLVSYLDACLCQICLAWVHQVQLPELMAVQGDVMLRALRFMDSMIQRDTMQKAAFLNDLTTFWHKFDDRVLRLKVLYADAAHISASCVALVFCTHCSLVLQISRIVDPASMQDLTGTLCPPSLSGT